jgi:hypothetical protein
MPLRLCPELRQPGRQGSLPSPVRLRISTLMRVDAQIRRQGVPCDLTYKLFRTLRPSKWLQPFLSAFQDRPE